MSEPDYYDQLIADLEARMKSAREYSKLMQETEQKLAWRLAKIKGASVGRGVCDNSGEAIDRVAERNRENREALRSKDRSMEP